jgi:hypothetical protein
MENRQIPVDEIFYNECTGEEVHLTGEMHSINHFFGTVSGEYHWGFNNKYHGVKGVGLTSGIQYIATGGDQGYGTTVEVPDQPYHYAAGSVISFRLLGQGGASDLQIQANGHVVVTPDFRFVVWVDTYRAICK